MTGSLKGTLVSCHYEFTCRLTPVCSAKTEMGTRHIVVSCGPIFCNILYEYIVVHVFMQIGKVNDLKYVSVFIQEWDDLLGSSCC